MAYENLLYEKKDGMAYITFNRPKVLNALNRKTIEELHHALLDAKNDDAVRVVILTGAGGKAFVAGGDGGGHLRATPGDREDLLLVSPGAFPVFVGMGQADISHR